jgi:hypothetical protein
VNSFAAASQLPIFNMFNYKGLQDEDDVYAATIDGRAVTQRSSTKQSKCEAWKQYQRSQLKIPFEDFYVSELRLRYQSERTSLSAAVAGAWQQDVVCKDKRKIPMIIASLAAASGGNAVVSTACGGAMWVVYSCPDDYGGLPHIAVLLQTPGRRA